MTESSLRNTAPRIPQVLQEQYLVNSIFTSEEAREVLLSLLNFKIEFHQRRSFSRLELNGHFDEESERRIGELRELSKQVLRCLEQACADGSRLLVRAKLEIEELPAEV